MPTYYLNSLSGDDASDGLSELRPWKSLDRLSAFAAQPGDTFRLQGGVTFPGTIRWDWRGISGGMGAPITVGSYGTGSATIASPPDQGAFLYTGLGGIRLENLTLKGRCSRYGASGATFGPTDGESDNISNITLVNLDVSGYGTAGVMLNGPSVDRPARNVALEDCRFTRNGLGTYLWSVMGLTLIRCVGNDNDGFPGNPGGNAGQGLTVYLGRDVLLEECRAERNGHRTPMAVGSAGIFLSSCQQLTAYRCWTADNGDQEKQDGQNLIVYGGKNNTIERCTAIGGLAGFCLFHDRWSGGPVERCQIIDSFASGNVTDISIVGDVFDSLISNNRVVCTGYKALDIADSDGTTRRNVRVVGNEFELRGGQFLVEAVPGLAGVEGLTANGWRATEAEPFFVRNRGYPKIGLALAAEPVGV